jgi:hypothetical protein
MRHHIHRRDRDHDVIFAALKKVTAVRDIHNYGGGMGDILARHTVTHQPVFLEVKSSESDKLTESEQGFRRDFGGFWRRVHTLDEALAAIGITKGPR